jgi:hypothetical protein
MNDFLNSTSKYFQKDYFGVIIFGVKLNVAIETK